MRMKSDTQFKVRAYYNAVQVHIDPNEAGRKLLRGLAGLRD